MTEMPPVNHCVCKAAYIEIYQFEKKKIGINVEADVTSGRAWVGVSLNGCCVF